jgi:predicted RNase H-like HicB family nuclease/predicted RNA binding protein YcfA (HicA-like mRNA interferase family)
VKVPDAIQRLENGGGRPARTQGHHRQHHQALKAGTVTVAGHPFVTFRREPWTIFSGGMKMKFFVIYEKSPSSWGAFLPDLPGLGVAGKAPDEVKELIRQAVEFHREGMLQHDEPIPAPSTTREYITV